MTSDVIRQTWGVKRGGYQWVTATFDRWERPGGQATTEGRVLVAPLGQLSLVTTYDPADVRGSALFRVFADTSPSEEGILDFANRYGALGGSAQRQLRHVDEPISTHSREVGEPFEEWRRQILDMRTAVTLWDLARREDTAKLARFVKWGADGLITLENVQELVGEALSQTVSFSPLVDPQYGDVLQATMTYLQDTVNIHQADVRPKLLWSEDRRRLVLHITNDSLIGSLWLQFATAISGNLDYRQCKQCGQWFQVETQRVIDVLGAPESYRRKRRTDREFCSNACRNRAYRTRLETAQRLHAHGLAVDDIAARLGTSAEMVGKWLRPKVDGQ